MTAVGDGSSGLRESHFPGRAPVDAYGNGGFRFAGMSHRGALLCVPSGIYAWRDVALPITVAMLQRVFTEADDIEVLLVGSGDGLVPLAAEVRERCLEADIVAEPMSTGAAVRTFNVLLADGRRVAAALLPVD